MCLGTVRCSLISQRQNDFGTDSSSRFPFKVYTDRHTDKTESPSMPADIADVGNKQTLMIQGGILGGVCGAVFERQVHVLMLHELVCKCL